MKRRVGEPLIQVHLLEKVGRKGLVKIRHIDGSHPGLEEYVRTSQIVAPWGQRLRFLRDEERLERVHELSKAVQDRALKGAVETVLYSTGHPDAGLSEDGSLHMSEGAAEELEHDVAAAEELAKKAANAAAKARKLADSARTELDRLEAELSVLD